jgi:hypothetical protein
MWPLSLSLRRYRLPADFLETSSASALRSPLLSSILSPLTKPYPTASARRSTAHTSALPTPSTISCEPSALHSPQTSTRTKSSLIPNYGLKCYARLPCPILTQPMREGHHGPPGPGGSNFCQNKAGLRLAQKNNRIVARCLRIRGSGSRSTSSCPSPINYWHVAPLRGSTAEWPETSAPRPSGR